MYRENLSHSSTSTETLRDLKRKSRGFVQIKGGRELKKLLIAIMSLMLLIGLVACSSDKANSKKELTVDEVIKAFKNAGLEAEKPRKMTKDDFGFAPMKSKEAKLIILPSVCEDCGGRVLSYDKKEDLDQMKKYYDELGKESAAMFSWTIKKDNILVQLNGDMKEEDFNKYKKALEELK